MPTPEQSRLSLGTTARALADSRAKGLKPGEARYGTPSSTPMHPVERERRYDRPGSIGQPGNFGSEASQIAMEQAVNRLPFFVEHEYRIHTPFEETVVAETSPTPIVLDTDGETAFRFQKYETWTDVIVRIDLSGYVVTSGTAVATKAIFTNQAGIEYDSSFVGRFYYNTVNQNHFWAGRRRVENMPPGVYTVTPHWWVDANSFRFGVDNTLTVTCIEAMPIPPILQ